jgi:pyruvate kinase
VDAELDAVAAAAVRCAASLGARMIVCITASGNIARALARCQPSVPVAAFCFDPRVARRLQLHRAVHPVLLTTAGRGLLARLHLAPDDGAAALDEVVRWLKAAIPRGRAF